MATRPAAPLRAMPKSRRASDGLWPRRLVGVTSQFRSARVARVEHLGDPDHEGREHRRHEVAEIFAVEVLVGGREGVLLEEEPAGKDAERFAGRAAAVPSRSPGARRRFAARKSTAASRSPRPRGRRSSRRRSRPIRERRPAGPTSGHRRRRAAPLPGPSPEALRPGRPTSFWKAWPSKVRKPSEKSFAPAGDVRQPAGRRGDVRRGVRESLDERPRRIREDGGVIVDEERAAAPAPPPRPGGSRAAKPDVASGDDAPQVRVAAQEFVHRLARRVVDEDRFRPRAAAARRQRRERLEQVLLPAVVHDDRPKGPEGSSGGSLTRRSASSFEKRAHRHTYHFRSRRQSGWVCGRGGGPDRRGPRGTRRPAGAATADQARSAAKRRAAAPALCRSAESVSTSATASATAEAVARHSPPGAGLLELARERPARDRDRRDASPRRVEQARAIGEVRLEAVRRDRDEQVHRRVEVGARGVGQPGREEDGRALRIDRAGAPAGARRRRAAASSRVGVLEEEEFRVRRTARRTPGHASSRRSGSYQS